MANGHGGKREGAGRKGIAEEKRKIKVMDDISDLTESWELVWELCKEKNIHALKLWIEHRWGKAKDRVDITSNDETLGSQFNLSKLNQKQLDALIALHGGNDTDTEPS